MRRRPATQYASWKNIVTMANIDMKDGDDDAMKQAIHRLYKQLITMVMPSGDGHGSNPDAIWRAIKDPVSLGHLPIYTDENQQNIGMT